MENEKMETQTKEKKQQDMEAAVQADIVEKIQEECDKDEVDNKKLTKLRYEQMLRGLYLWQNPFSF